MCQRYRAMDNRNDQTVNSRPNGTDMQTKMHALTVCHAVWRLRPAECRCLSPCHSTQSALSALSSSPDGHHCQGLMELPTRYCLAEARRLQIGFAELPLRARRQSPDNTAATANYGGNSAVSRILMNSIVYDFSFVSDCPVWTIVWIVWITGDGPSQSVPIDPGSMAG